MGDLVCRRGEGRPVHVLGADLTIKVSSRDTNGAFVVFEGHTPPLDGPPLHRHPGQDEWWYIVGREYRFEIDGKQILASAGDVVSAPRGAAPGPGKMRTVFEKYGQELPGPPVRARAAGQSDR